MCHPNQAGLALLTTKINDVKSQIQLQYPNADDFLVDGVIFYQIQEKYPNLSNVIKLASAELLQKSLIEIKAKFQKVLDKYKQKYKQNEAVYDLQELMYNQKEDMMNLMSSYFKSKTSSDKKSDKKQKKSLKEAQAEKLVNSLKSKLGVTTIHQCLCYDRIEQMNILIDELYEQSCEVIQREQLSAQQEPEMIKPQGNGGSGGGVKTQSEGSSFIGLFNKATDFFKKEEQQNTLQPQDPQEMQSEETKWEVVETSPLEEQGSEFQLIFKRILDQIYKEENITEQLTLLGSTEQKILMVQILFACIAPFNSIQKEALLSRILNLSVPILFSEENEQSLYQIRQKIKEDVEKTCHQSLQQIEEGLLSQNTADTTYKSTIFTILYLSIFEVIHRSPSNKFVIRRNKNDPQLRELMLRYYKRTFQLTTLKQFFQMEYLLSQYQITGNEPQLDPTSFSKARDLDLTKMILDKSAMYVGTSAREDKFFMNLEQEKPICRFVQLYSPPANSNKHIVICISGFLSENANFDEDWKHLIASCKESQTPLFTVQWSASKASTLIQTAVKKIDGEGITTALSAKNLFTMKNLISIKNYVIDAGVDQAALFRKTRENARLTGNILGHVLAAQDPFDSYSISLIGFSLGTQVIKSCLNTLYSLKAESPIHNVYLLGGAAYIKPPKVEQQKLKFSKIIHGKIRNVHTNTDSILEVLFFGLYKEEAIGRKNIYDTDILNIEYFKPNRGMVEENYINLKNYDISSFCNGHLEYRKFLDKIMHFIEFEN